MKALLRCSVGSKRMSDLRGPSRMAESKENKAKPETLSTVRNFRQRTVESIAMNSCQSLLMLSVSSPGRSCSDGHPPGFFSSSAFSVLWLPISAAAPKQIRRFSTLLWPKYIVQPPPFLRALYTSLALPPPLSLSLPVISSNFPELLSPDNGKGQRTYQFNNAWST